MLYGNNFILVIRSEFWQEQNGKLSQINLADQKSLVSEFLLQFD